MNGLIYLIYSMLWLLILFEGAKFTDTLIKEKLEFSSTGSSPTTEISSYKNRIKESLKDKKFTSYISLTPLFEKSQETPEAGQEKSEIQDSPLLHKYQLTGIIYLGTKRSIALIRKRGEKESRPYHVNDNLDSAVITKIAKDRVYLNYMGQTVVLPMYYRVVQKAARPSNFTLKTGESGPQNYASSKKIRKVLSRSDVENKVFKRVNQILTQIAISPYMKNGKMEGIRLIRVPKNNIVYELGGRSGDIIKRVNGHELNQIDQLYKLWENIKDDSLISVDLERNHQIYTYTFEIRE